MEKIYDLIIIGAGPAGITAAIYAARKKMDFLVLTGDIGGQTAWSGKIENYTGYQLVTGVELTAKFEEHIKNYGVNVRDNEPVVKFGKEGSALRVKTAKRGYLSRTVIIASGKKSRELGVPGEKEFKNKGLTYCATCDGPLFQGKDVAVIGGGNSALDAALQLIAIASSVHIVNNSPGLSGDEIMLEKVTSDKKVKVHNSSEVIEIFGTKFVEGVIIKSGDGKKKLTVEGVFVEIGLDPNSLFAEGVTKNDKGEIVVNCRTETNIPGVFAAGDVTDVIEKQIIIAAGEGSKAALQAFRYLARRREET